MTLEELVADFAIGIQLADARKPVAVNRRSGDPFLRGIGPHSEEQTIQLVMSELAALKASAYANQFGLGVPYPEFPRQRCDLCLGHAPQWDWGIEVKMLRILGDNGRANDNMLMHIFSPYPAHRSAVTDCWKLAQTRLARRRGILIYGYDAEQWPLEPAISAFEVLASSVARLGPRKQARFSGLVHPVHASGCVFAWELVDEQTNG